MPMGVALAAEQTMAPEELCNFAPDSLLVYNQACRAMVTNVRPQNYAHGSRFVVFSCGLPQHDDVIKWKHFPRYWSFVPGIHRSPVNSPHKGQ